MSPMRRTTQQLLIGLLLLLHTALVRGDGGAIQAMARSGEMQISVFTSPSPLVAGPVDLSILVQEAKTLATLEAAEVLVTITPRDRPYAAETHPATREQATNKLFRDCHIELTAGLHNVEVAVRSGAAHERVTLAIDVGPPPTRAAAFWPWFSWPAIPLSLLLAHIFLAGRTGRAPN